MAESIHVEGYSVRVGGFSFLSREVRSSSSLQCQGHFRVTYTCRRDNIPILLAQI